MPPRSTHSSDTQTLQGLNHQFKYSAYWFLCSLVIGLAVAWLSPQSWFHGGWLNHDQGWYLSQLDQFLAGGKIYSGVATPYGPLPYAWHHALASVLGNTVTTYVLGQIIILGLASVVAWSALTRVLPLRTAFITMVLGILPFHFKVVTTMIYDPLTVLEMAVIVMMWRRPSHSTLSRNLMLGIVLGAGQWVKFGHFAIFGAAVLIVDVLASWQSTAPLPLLKTLLRRWCLIGLGFLLLEIPFVGWVLWNNPNAIGMDAIWPYYQNDAYVVFGPDERMWGAILHMEWKPLISRVGPAVFLLLAVLVVFWQRQLFLRRVGGQGDKEEGELWETRLCLLIPALAHLLGCFTLFSSTNHLWSYAWLIGWSTASGIFDRLGA